MKVTMIFRLAGGGPLITRTVTASDLLEAFELGIASLSDAQKEAVRSVEFQVGGAA